MTRKTIKHVAEEANVSIGTVSKVLNGDPTVNARLREQVHAACDELGYRPNQVAASLRRQSSQIVGILLPDIMNTFYAELVAHLEDLAAESSYSVIITTGGENPGKMEARARSLVERGVDGAIVIPSLNGSELLSPAIGNRFPIVVVDRISANDSFPTVATENVSAARAGTEYLLSIGHRKIAMVSNSPKFYNTIERIEGYKSGMISAGIEPTILIVGRTAADAEQGVTELLASEDPPTALFTANSDLTKGAVKSLRKRGLHMPDDISLLGFDDCDWLSLVEPQISSIRQPIYQIAQAAWDQLLLGIQGNAVTLSKTRLDADLIVRGSTSPVGLSQVNGAIS